MTQPSDSDNDSQDEPQTPSMLMPLSRALLSPDQRPSARPPTAQSARPSARPSSMAPVDRDRMYRPWSVRRPNGSLSALPNNGELRAWVEDGRIQPEDELSPDGQHWTVLGTIPNLDVYIQSAPTPRARRASSMAMPAVRLPTDEPVRVPSLSEIPAAPKLPSLSEIAHSVAPPAAPTLESLPRASERPQLPEHAGTASIPPPELHAKKHSLSPLALDGHKRLSTRPEAPATSPGPTVRTSIVPMPVTASSRPSALKTAPADADAKAPEPKAAESVAKAAPTVTKTTEPAEPARVSVRPAPEVEPTVTSPSGHARASEPPPRQVRSVPPPSFSVDPALYTDVPAPEQRPVAPGPSTNQGRALALLTGFALVTSSVALVQSTRTSMDQAPAAQVVRAIEPTAGVEALRLDEGIEQLTARLGLVPSEGISRVRRARLLALRAWHQRGLAEDLEALGARLQGDERLLNLAEARVLRRNASHDAQRAQHDAQSVGSEVPPSAQRSEWLLALAHAYSLGERTSTEGADVVRSARSAQAKTAWVEAMVARAQGDAAGLGMQLERATLEPDAPLAALLALGRAARQRGDYGGAREFATRATRLAPHDEGVISLMRTLAADPTASTVAAPSPATSPETPPPSPSPSPAEAQADAGAQQAVGTETEAPTTQDGTAVSPSLREYRQRVESGRLALQQRMHPRARDEFRRALALKPDGVEAQIGLAWVALRIGYLPIALRSFRRLMSQGHDTAEVRVGLGVTLTDLRDREEALRYLRPYLAGHSEGWLASEARRAVSTLGG
ncbi:MAG: hypothetical protein Q8Q09_09030 [Deltaproteobacteria bacterium]|nr:hypothetical protein [Deltaproteobacteria bacterium]